MARKRRKLDSGEPLPAELPEAPDREADGSNSTLPGEQHPPAELQVLAVEICAPMNKEVPFVLIAKP